MSAWLSLHSGNMTHINYIVWYQVLRSLFHDYVSMNGLSHHQKISRQFTEDLAFKQLVFLVNWNSRSKIFSYLGKFREGTGTEQAKLISLHIFLTDSYVKGE